jgi:hypothetical protein
MQATAQRASEIENCEERGRAVGPSRGSESPSLTARTGADT